MQAIRWIHKQKLYTMVQACTKCLGSWGESAISLPGWRQERAGGGWASGVRGYIHQESRGKRHSERGNRKSSHAAVKVDDKFRHRSGGYNTKHMRVNDSAMEGRKAKEMGVKECSVKCSHAPCVLIDLFLEINYSVCKGHNDYMTPYIFWLLGFFFLSQMASPTQWTWVWVDSGSWWWTGRPGMLQFLGSQRVRQHWATELNWTEHRLCFWLPVPNLKRLPRWH